MLKKIRFLFSLLLISAEILTLSSCENKAHGDPDEVFFDGQPVNLSSEGAAVDGNYMYYVQDGRMVKVDLETLGVTCACIDPLCSHEYDSDCPMSFGMDRITNIGIIGHWLYFIRTEPDKPGVYMGYNLDTGENREFFSRNNVLGDTTMFFSSSPVAYNGKLYTVICEFTEDAKTKEDIEYCLASYDFENDKMKHIFQLDDVATLNAITNKRIYFAKQDGNGFSVDHNGKNRVDDCSFNRLAVWFNGTYAYTSCDYLYDENGRVCGNSDHCSMYDLKTGEWKNVPDGGGWSVIPKGDSLYYIAYDNMSEYAALNQANYDLLHNEMTDEQKKAGYKKLRNEYVIDGSISLMRSDADGSNPTVIATYPSSKMIVRFACGNYVCVIMQEYDREAFDTSGEVRIVRQIEYALLDLTTGELKEIPKSRN